MPTGTGETNQGWGRHSQSWEKTIGSVNKDLTNVCVCETMHVIMWHHPSNVLHCPGKFQMCFKVCAAEWFYLWQITTMWFHPQWETETALLLSVGQIVTIQLLISFWGFTFPQSVGSLVFFKAHTWYELQVLADSLEGQGELREITIFIHGKVSCQAGASYMIAFLIRLN